MCNPVFFSEGLCVVVWAANTAGKSCKVTTSTPTALRLIVAMPSCMLRTSNKQYHWRLVEHSKSGKFKVRHACHCKLPGEPLSVLLLTCVFDLCF
jgi:hypothetical protein